MTLSDRLLINDLNLRPFAVMEKLTGALGEPSAIVSRTLTSLLTDGADGRMSHGTVHLEQIQMHPCRLRKSVGPQRSSASTHPRTRCASTACSGEAHGTHATRELPRPPKTVLQHPSPPALTASISAGMDGDGHRGRDEYDSCFRPTAREPNLD